MSGALGLKSETEYDNKSLFCCSLMYLYYVEVL